MNNLNSVLIEGNLVRDPEYRTTAGGSGVCNFTVASNRYYKKVDGFEKEVGFFDVEVWGKPGEKANEIARKGRGVRVVGRLKQDRWQGSDGKAMSRVVIVADHIEYRAETKNGSAEAEEVDAAEEFAEEEENLVPSF